MTITAVLGAIVAVLGGIVALVIKLWRGAAQQAKVAGEQRDAERTGRFDDAGRFERVIEAKKAEAARPLPDDIKGIRDGITQLGGAPLPPKKGKPS
jgi:hypothetical protein